MNIKIGTAGQKRLNDLIDKYPVFEKNIADIVRILDEFGLSDDLSNASTWARGAVVLLMDIQAHLQINQVSTDDPYRDEVLRNSTPPPQIDETFHALENCQS